MKPKIIYEDEYLFVLDKPAGWIVNESGTVGNTPVIQSWLKENFKYEIVQNQEVRSGIVHRIDKETSGVLVVAKTKKIFKNLQDLFKKREVTKTYTALVHGKVEPKSGNIKAPVGRLPWNRQRFGVLPGGREAETKYFVKGNIHNLAKRQDYSLLELSPKTGRTHQIRIHLKYLGHAIVADEFYAGRKTARADRKWCPRLFLHASKISFIHPSTKKKITIEADLPKELKDPLRFLAKSI